MCRGSRPCERSTTGRSVLQLTSDGCLGSLDGPASAPATPFSFAVEVRRVPATHLRGDRTATCRHPDLRAPCSCSLWRVLLRGREDSDLTPFISFRSASSGGSDKGLDVDDSGLDGGLSSSPAESGVLARPRPEVWMFTCVFRLASRCCLFGDSAGELRTRSQNCSYGRITRLYELRICVASPGTPL